MIEIILTSLKTTTKKNEKFHNNYMYFISWFWFEALAFPRKFPTYRMYKPVGLNADFLFLSSNSIIKIDSFPGYR